MMICNFREWQQLLACIEARTNIRHMSEILRAEFSAADLDMGEILENSREPWLKSLI
jgi:hypothetical protein